MAIEVDLNQQDNEVLKGKSWLDPAFVNPDLKKKRAAIYAKHRQAYLQKQQQKKLAQRKPPHGN